MRVSQTLNRIDLSSELQQAFIFVFVLFFFFVFWSVFIFILFFLL